MGFSRMSQWMVLALMPIYLVTGCGDLEPEMQDTRTVILKMDFDQRSSSRTSSVSAAELSDYKTHFIMAQPSSEHFSSSYLYPKSLAEGLMDPVSRKITLKLKLHPDEMKIFVFLFSEKVEKINDFEENFSKLINDSQSYQQVVQNANNELKENFNNIGQSAKKILDNLKNFENKNS